MLCAIYIAYCAESSLLEPWAKVILWIFSLLTAVVPMAALVYEILGRVFAYAS